MKSPRLLVDKFKACVAIAIFITIIIVIAIVLTLIEWFISKGSPKYVLNVFYGLVLNFADVCMFCLSFQWHVTW